MIQAAFRRGLLLLGCGESGVRFCPPLCVTAEQVETCLAILDEVLSRSVPEPGAGLVVSTFVVKPRRGGFA